MAPGQPGANWAEQPSMMLIQGRPLPAEIGRVQAEALRARCDRILALAANDESQRADAMAVRLNAATAGLIGQLSDGAYHMARAYLLKHATLPETEDLQTAARLLRSYLQVEDNTLDVAARRKEAKSPHSSGSSRGCSSYAE